MDSNSSSFPVDVPQRLFHILHTIELSFDERRVIPWMSDHWHWSIYSSIIYLLLIYWGQKYMKDKLPYDLRGAHCCWSAGVSLFSLFAVCRTYPIAYSIIYTGGFKHAVCDTSSYIGSSGAGIWAFLFLLTKPMQLLDTSFLILQKLEVYTLHWYHHVTVLIYSWYSYGHPISVGTSSYSYGHPISIGTCFGIVNCIMHVITYGYYTVKLCGVFLPGWVNKALTVSQILQLLAAIFFNYLAVQALLENKTCAMSFSHIGTSLFLYVSYAILLGLIFIRKDKW